MSEEFKTIELGLDAEAFFKGNIGKALMGKAQVQAAEAMEKLKTIKSYHADVSNFNEAVSDLQGIIERAENFEGWVIELIREGGNAEELVLQNDIVD
jgi:hypothetical protein